MAPQADELDSKPQKKYAHYALGMLTVAYALNFIDRQILVILQEPIKIEMGLSDLQLGLLSGFSFALVYITAGIPIAYWADRGNRRNIIALAITVWSGMTALSGMAGSYTHLLLARIGVGIGEAGGSPPAHSMISDYYPAHQRGTAMSVYSMGIQLGVLVGFLAGGFIAQAFGWRTAFMAVGLPGILFALIFFFTVKEPRRGYWEASNETTHKPSLGETLKTLSGYRSFWYLALGAGLAAFTGYGNGNFAPSFLMRIHGLSVAEVGIVLALLAGLGGMLGTFLGGYLADKWGREDKRWYLWVPAIAGLIAVPLGFPYLLLDNTAIVIGLTFFVVVFANTYIGPCIAISHTLAPPAMRAMTSAVLLFVINIIGMGLGPVTAGVLSDYFTGIYGPDGLRYAMLIIGLVGLPGLACLLMAARHLPADLARNAERINAS